MEKKTSTFFHSLSIYTYGFIIIVATVYFGWLGYSYYTLPVIDRFDHPMFEQLKPSGLIGHGLGIIGTLLILIGVIVYMARKRIKIFRGLGFMKYWLEFHIFLCTLGPVLVLYHTTFKFGGIVSIAFWSMAVVWLSGFVGRYLFIQIPRTINGRELSLKEVQDMRDALDAELMTLYNIDMHQLASIKASKIDAKLKMVNIAPGDVRKIKKLMNKERSLGRRIQRLSSMRNLFKHWHVIHLPFSILMLIITIVHVTIQLLFGYKWMF